MLSIKGDVLKLKPMTVNFFKFGNRILIKFVNEVALNEVRNISRGFCHKKINNEILKYKQTNLNSLKINK